MAVTVTTHSQAGTWTATQLRSLFETSFIANGIMTAWYDSFTSGSCELGVVERVYNGAKTYGTSYYVFKFSTTGIYVYVCDSWNAATHVPDGTVHDTYASGYSFSTTTGGNGEFTFMNVTGGGAATSIVNFASTRAWTFSPSVEVQLYCYTSGVDTNFKWFELRQGTNYGSFIFPTGVASNYDLDVWCANHLMTVNGYRASGYSSFSFAALASGIRRGLVGSSICGTDTSITTSDSSYIAQMPAQYIFNDSDSASSSSNGSATTNSSGAGITLPSLRAAQLSTPPGSDLYYVHTGLFYDCYNSTPNLPSDFGLYIAEDGNTSVANRDVLVVSAGVEEYTVLHAISSSAAGPGTCWGAFVCRTV